MSNQIILDHGQTHPCFVQLGTISPKFKEMWTQFNLITKIVNIYISYISKRFLFLKCFSHMF
jgi:hypothetical protein